MFRIYLHWKLHFIALAIVAAYFVAPTALFAQNAWTTGASPTTTEPFDGVGGAINGKFYMVAQGFGPVLEIYDPATDSWTTGTPMSSYREVMIGGVINNKLYVGGGRDWSIGGVIVSTFEMYDPATDSWTPKASMPTPLFNASATTYNGKLYVIGGYDGSTAVQTVRIYDPTTDSWSIGSSMATPRVKAAVGVINGKIYVAGGGNGGSVLNTMEIYDPATNSWTTGPNMSVAHYSSAFGVLNNELYVVSGRTTGFDWTNVTEIYNPTTGWRTGTAIPTTRDMSMSDAINNKLYVVGGGNMNGYTNVLEILDPSVAPPPNNAPTANAGVDQTVLGGMPIQLDGSMSTDPDGNFPLTYRWTQTAGTTVSLSDVTAENPTFMAPTVLGNLTFSLVVTDSLGLASTADQVVVTVDVVPIMGLTAVASSPTAIGRTIYFTATISQGSDVNYYWYFGDGDSATGATVSHVYNTSGNYVAAVTASNAANSQDEYVNIDITNNPPIANAGSDRTVGIGTTVTLTGSGSYDPDGHTISYQWNQFGGAGVSLSNSNIANPTFVAPTMPDILSFDLIVIDQYGEISPPDQVVITVVNNEPIANAGPDQTVNPGAMVTLNGSGSSDPDGHSLSYQWTQMGGTPVSLSNSTSANPTFTAPAAAGTLTFQLEVTDEYGLSDATPDTVVITVAETPPPFLMKWGTSGSGNGQFNNPYGFALDSAGNVYVSDAVNNRIQKFDSAGNFVMAWGSSGNGDGQFTALSSLAVDANNNVYATDSGGNRVQKFDRNGTFLLKWGSAGTGNGQLNTPHGIAIDSSGMVYVVDHGNNRIQKFNSSGSYQGQWGSGGTGNGQFNGPAWLAIDIAGNVYVSDHYNHRIQKFDSNGNYLMQWGSNGTGDGQFNLPSGIALDASGNVYIADIQNARIQKFTSAGVFLTKWGSSGAADGQFQAYGVAVNRDGNIYVADVLNRRIQKFGTITAINGLTVTTSSPTTLGQVTSFTATLGAGTDVNYTWNFGDGSVTSSGQPSTITHTYAAFGNYTTIVTATNNAGSSSRSATVAVVQCFASLGSTTQYSSGNAQAVRDAITAATPGQVVKIAGNCSGAISENGSTQVAYVNKAVTLRGGYTTTNWTTSDPTVNVTTLDAQSGGRVLYINGVNLTLENLTLQNGSVSGPGGGVFASNSLTLTSVNVRNSSANGGSGEGGGIYASGVLSVSNSNFALNSAGFRGGSIRAVGNAQISNSQILSNTSGVHGGGIAADAQLILYGGLFQNNLSSSSGGGVMIYNTGSLIITNTQFISNTADQIYAGGGVYQQGSNPVLINGAWFERNRATDGSTVGGGGAAIESPNSTILNTSWISNSVNNGAGGGLYLYTNGTVTNNTFRGNSASGNGGALYSNAALTITNSTFQDNHSTGASGGALLFGGASTISNTQFFLNSAAGSGGAIYANSSLNLINTNILSNTAAGGGGGLFLPVASFLLTMNGGLIQNNVSYDAGGGVMISAYNSVIVTNTQFISNTQLAVWGGGAFYHQGNGSITITGAWFERNSSPNASAPYGGGAATLGAPATILNTSWISNSTGAHGGAVTMGGTIRNNTFRGNNANGFGGAVYAATTLEIVNSTFTANSSSQGSALYNNSILTVTNSTLSANNGSSAGGSLYNPSGKTLYLRNSILANSIGSNNDCENLGTLAANINNLIESNNGCSSGAIGLVTSDPNLAPLADNGGIATGSGAINQTFALNFNSPAIEAGDNATCDSTDGRGVARPIDGDSDGVALCDIGAYEAAVGSANAAPVANAGPDQTVLAGATVTLNGSASTDPDGQSLTYGWAQTGGTAVTLSNATVVSPTFTAPASVGMLTFTLAVTDSLGLAANITDTVVINVMESPPPFLMTIGSGGTGNGQFQGAHDVAVDSNGTLYATDYNGNHIQKFDSAGNFLARWGSSGSGSGQFSGPGSVAVDSAGNVYVAEVGNNRIQKFSSTGTYLTQWSVPNVGQIVADSSGNLYATIPANSLIRKYDSNGTLLSSWGSGGTGDGQLSGAQGLAIDSSGNLYVADTGNHRIQKFTSSGTYLLQWGSHGTGNGQFNIPYDVAIDSSDNVYVTDRGNNRIQKFASSGTFLSVWSSGASSFNNPIGLTINSSNNLYVADFTNNRIQKFGSLVALSGLTVVNSSPTTLGNVTFFTATLAAGNDFNYTWNFGDGNVTSSGQPTTSTHTYAAPGSYSAIVTATNGLGSLNKTLLVTVTDVALNGLALNSSSPTVLGQATYFTASISTGTNATYLWNFGDGAVVSSQQSAVMSHTYALAGNYTTVVTATNSAGNIASTTAVTITNAAPVANAGADLSVNVATTVILNGSASNDSDGHTPLTYRWQQTGGPAVTLGNASLVTTTFVAPGTPSVLTFTLTVTDARGLVSSNADQVVITVVDTPILGLNASSSSPTILGQTTSFTATTTSGSNLVYSWNFGDGTTASGATANHVYALAGVYTAIVTATNASGSVNASTVVNITNAQPIANAGSDQIVKVGSTVLLSGTGSYDPDGHAPLSYGWVQTGGFPVTLSNSSSSTPSFVASSTPDILIFVLIVMDSRGLVSVAPDSVVIRIEDYPIGGLVISNTSPTRLTDVTTFTTSILTGTNVLYYWDLGDGTLINQQMDVTHTYSAAGIYTASVTAVNGVGIATASRVVTITNSTPLANAGPDQTVKVGSNVTLDASSSSDPDGHTPLTYSWIQSGGPTVTLSDPSSRTPTFTAPAAASVLTFTLTVIDSQGAVTTSPDPVVITVQDYNISGLSTDTSSPTRLTGVTYFTATVVTGTGVLYAWSFGDGLTISNQLSGVMNHTYALAGTYTTIVTATNGQGSVNVSTPVTITNAAPLANASSDQVVKVNSTVSLDGSASYDPDAHTPLTYGWTQVGGPTVLLSSATVSQPTFVAPSTPSVLTFTLTVSDSQGLRSISDAQVQITVEDYAIGGLAISSSSPTRLTDVTSFTATVVTGTNVIYTWYTDDMVLNTQETGVISITYPLSGTYLMTVRASNGQGNVSVMTPVTITNAAPIANASSDQVVKVSSTVNLDGAGSYDPDGHTPLTYGWTQIGGPTVVLSSDTISQPTFVAPTASSVLTFTLTVTDSRGLRSTSDAQVQITIEDYAIGDLAAINSSPTRLTDVTFFTATVATGTNILYAWDFGDGQVVNSQASGVMSHTYASVGFYTTMVTATNTAGSVTVSQPVTITNSAPIADANLNQTVKVNSTVTLDASNSSDPDGHLPLTYQWLQNGGPAVALDNPNSSTPSFVAPTAPATLVFVLLVTDSQGAETEAPAQVTITVQDYDISGLSVDNSSPTRLTEPTNFTATMISGTNVIYTWDFGDGVGVSSQQSGVISHTYPAAGFYTATLTASNGQGSIGDSMVVQVTNSASVADAGVDQTVKVDSTVTLNGSNSYDPDGHLPLSYSWVQSGGLTVTLSHVTAAMPTFVAPSTPSVLTFTLTVTDSQGMVALTTDQVVITVEDYVVAGLNTSNSSPTRLTDATTFTATVITGTNVLYRWSFGDGAVVNSQASGVMSHTYASVGIYTAMVTATNSLGMVSSTLPVTVTNVAPVANTGNNQVLKVSSTVSLNGAGSYDLDNHTPLTYRWLQSGGPTVILSSAAISQPTFVAPTSPTVLTFTLTVTDSQGLRSSSDAQIQTTIEDYEIGGLAALNSSSTRLTDLTYFTATVLTGTNVSYAWNFGDGTVVSSQVSGILSHDYGRMGSYTAIVTATNGQGSVSVSTPVTITNTAPLANAGSDQIVKVGTTVNLNGSSSGDPDGHTPLAYRWQQSGGLAVTLSDATSNTPSFVAPTTPTVLTFTLSVTDSQGLGTALADPVVITVQDYDITGLALASSSPTRIKQATTFTATITAGSNVLYTWNFGDGVTVGSQQSAVSSHTYTATGQYTATVSASNGQGSSSASTQVQVKVLANAEASVTAFVDAPTSLRYAPLNGGNFELEVPAGAVTATTTILYDGLPAPTDLPGTVLFGNRAFRLTAYQEDELLGGISFQAPLTITIDYVDSDVAGLDERLLTLYYFDTASNQWTSAGVKVVQRDPLNNRLVVRVTHFTDFAMVQRQVAHCSQEELELLLMSGVTQLDLDGACVYALTQSDSGYSFFDLWNKQNMVIDGHGATIERAATAPEKGILAFFQSQNVTVKNLILRGGKATTGYGLGGGLWLYHSTANLENVQLLGNSANTGGGIQVEGADSNLSIINSVFANNTAVDRGAAIFATGALHIRNSTMVDTSGNPKQGILTWASAAISNTIVTGYDVGVMSAGSNTVISEDYNVFANNGTDTQELGGGQFVNGGHSNSYQDLRFVDATNDDYRLAFTSPAIDKGADLGISLDAAGQSRPFAGGLVDVGAYEFQGQGGPALAIYRQNPIAAAPDLSFVYRLLVLNQGVADASDLIVSDTLPDGVTVAKGSISDGGALVGNQVQWSLNSLAVGQGKVLSYRATSSQSVQNGEYRVYSTSNPAVFAIGRNLTTTINSQVLASLSFAPIPDGYRFANYGDIMESDLSEADMVTIFGADAVCKTQNPCVLTTSASAWRAAWLANLRAGHSAGMAVSSLRLFNDPTFAPGLLQPAANFTNDLNREEMRRWIALYSTIQEQTPLNAADLEAQGLLRTPAATPSAVLDALIANLRQPDAADRYWLLFAKSPTVRGGGWHGVVPYAIQAVSSDEYLIRIYDPNTPNRSDRAIQIKRSNDSWSYVSAAAPDRPLYDYFGDATSNNFRLVSQQWMQSFPKLCDTACAAQSASAATEGSSLNNESNIEFQLDGEGYFLVTRSDGKRVGYDLINGTPILEIPGAIQLPVASGFGLNIPPGIRIAHVEGMTYEVTVASRDTAYGNSEAVANFNISGPNYVVRVTNIKLTMPLIAVNVAGTLLPSTMQAIDAPFDSLDLGLDPDHNRLALEAGNRSSEAPDLAMAINNPQGADFSFSFGGLAVQPGYAVAMAFDPNTSRLSVENNDPNSNSYTVDVERLGQDGKAVNASITATDGESVGTVLHLDDSWQGNTAPVTEPNNTVTLPDPPRRYYLPIMIK